MPMLKERIGGTCVVVLKRDEAWSIVPSPPRVVVRSTFSGRREVVVDSVSELRAVVYMGKLTEV